MAGREVSYFGTRNSLEEWTAGGQTVPMSFWHRPLHAMTDACTAAGFRLAVISEQQPVPEARELFPQVRGVVVADGRDANVDWVAGPRVAAELQELGAVLGLLDVAVELVLGQVVGGGQVPDPVWAGVGCPSAGSGIAVGVLVRAAALGPPPAGVGSALTLWITSRTWSALVNVTSAIFVTSMPYADSRTICARRQVRGPSKSDRKIQRIRR
ncbi:hypothetical protein AB0J28_05565 [Streptosporangium canum]|uniref:hypothetical protein n=1 Tax=Streptosporangium canum TaxID=324952 RepID=UPI00343EDF5E